MTRAASTLLLLIATCALSQTHLATRPRKEPIRVPLEDQPTDLAQAEEAIHAYQKAAALTPKDPEPQLSAGLLRERRKDFPGAEVEYKQVLVLDPHSSEAVIGLTNIYMKSGRVAEAEPLLRQLATDRPDDSGLHLQLGRVLAAQGKKDEAIPEIQTALKLSPNDSEAQRDLADLLKESGKSVDSEKTYRDLLKANPNDP